MTDSKVDHPSYYGGKNDPYEAIKVIDAWGLDFCLGNAIKYISRAGKKDPERLLQDLNKAKWYLEHEIERLGVKNKKDKEQSAREKCKDYEKTYLNHYLVTLHCTPEVPTYIVKYISNIGVNCYNVPTLYGPEIKIVNKHIYELSPGDDYSVNILRYESYKVMNESEAKEFLNKSAIYDKNSNSLDALDFVKFVHDNYQNKKDKS